MPFFWYNAAVKTRAKVVFFIVIIALLGVMSFSIFKTRSERNNQVYRFDFEDGEVLDDFWLVSRFGSFQPSGSLMKRENGNLVLYSAKNGDFPMLVSRPLDLPPGNVISVKRRVRITRGDSIFSGGFALFQTDGETLIPEKKDSVWIRNVGDAVVLVEYSYDLLREEKRPGKNVFRLLAADWQENNNYEILKPIYDEWFEETLSYDTRNSTVHYKVNDREYILNSYLVDKPAMRVLMHSMGAGDESRIEIDYIEVRIEDKSFRRIK